MIAQPTDDRAGRVRRSHEADVADHVAVGAADHLVAAEPAERPLLRARPRASARRAAGVDPSG